VFRIVTVSGSGFDRGVFTPLTSSTSPSLADTAICASALNADSATRRRQNAMRSGTGRGYHKGRSLKTFCVVISSWFVISSEGK
jgi:hypothetical protein